MDKSTRFQISFVLSRVLNSGIIMSIEKNEKEIKGLESAITKITKLPYVSTFNSYTGALHGALQGNDIGHGDSVTLSNTTDQEEKFIDWLGISNQYVIEQDSFERFSVNWQNIGSFEEELQQPSTLVLDFTELGFGPCALMATQDNRIWEKAERLKIFGAFDLRTMWTQEESHPDLQPGIQFNYRISPLVAACAKLSLLKRGEMVENRFFAKTT
ncbi:degT/DnrJ/EryC1/StrS aminotransferase [Gracilibacillus salinarum]|uniref:DegT/DnrJ/EryC1/StrS aminotransferase n=1 Tax=Gracilibacillus salinarum TaxID=2932255 RepID=A0ABY4GH01_9BACI|nr:degT/DnrJ/EryC1/StrS aminotransferase [Gracilibacillus salinarum]UOQ83484.1 degT/DnrJ/EryC1/StrS aminotransferase [Gracilibacillus salinarum]